LPDILILQLGILPLQLGPVRIERHGLDDASDRQPGVSDARLAAQPGRIAGDSIEGLHGSNQVESGSASSPIDDPMELLRDIIPARTEEDQGPQSRDLT
jgi:hypothetical protein